ncbi:MAG TPA: hypothetical protein VHC18_20870 [Amycolatopsis sp.]|nr:hypothetical protein [Amycolatopsis sp.]
MAAFSPREVTWREWVALASGLVAVGALFLPWTNLTATNQDAEEALRESPAGEVARNAFTTGFLAYAGPVLLLLAGLAMVAFGQNRKARVSGLPHLWLTACAVTLVLMILGWLAITRQFDEDARALLEAGGVGIYGGVGRYAGLACALASTVAAVWDVRLTRRPGKPAGRR